MTMKTLPVPISSELCYDLIAFSDARVSLDHIGQMAENQLWTLLEFAFDDIGPSLFGDRAIEFARKHFPDIAQEWEDQGYDTIPDGRMGRKPLVWKHVTVPHGSEVRMKYGGAVHYAKIEDGAILDSRRRFTPSEWASKVANGTSRNAWRDLWFKEPGKDWVPAVSLRENRKR